MDILDEQDKAITLSLGNYNRDKSEIIFEGGTRTKDDFVNNCFIGVFIANIYGKGKYRFDCVFETIDGKRKCVVGKKKLQSR